MGANFTFLILICNLLTIAGMAVLAYQNLWRMRFNRVCEICKAWEANYNMLVKMHERDKEKQSN